MEPLNFTVFFTDGGVLKDRGILKNDREMIHHFDENDNIKHSFSKFNIKYIRYDNK